MERVVKILDSNYQKADLDKVVEDATNLNRKQKQMLLKILKRYKKLFDGTLGKWKTNPVKIDIRPGSELVNSQWYIVPQINKLTLKNN